MLRPRGGVMLYTALPTSLLEPAERDRLLTALDAPAWWGSGRAPIDDAVNTAGFDVVGFDV